MSSRRQKSPPSPPWLNLCSKLVFCYIASRHSSCHNLCIGDWMGFRETVSIGTPLKSQRIHRCENGVHSNSYPNLSLFPLKCSSNWLCHFYVPVFVSHPDIFGHTLCPLFSRGSFKTNSSFLRFSLESTPVAYLFLVSFPFPSVGI